MSVRPDMPDADSLDLLLKQAMSARPEECAATDLVAAALTRAQAREAQVASLTRLGRWIGTSVVAAGLLVAVSVMCAIHGLPASASSSQAQTSGQSADASTGSNESEMAIVVLAGAMAVGIALAGVMGADRRAPRLVPSA